MINQSEVKRILTQIAEEYKAGQNGLHGLAQGIARHNFITARMENMADLQNELMKLIGDQAIELVAVKLDDISPHDA